MGRLCKPYIKCEKRDGRLHLTAMKGGFQGHVLVGRADVAAGDEVALQAAASKLIVDARAADQKVGM